MPPSFTYSPGRFAYLEKKHFFSEMWGYLSAPDTVQALTTATDNGLPAIFPILDEIEERWGPAFASDPSSEEDIIVLCNNMIKQIMEQSGYEHAACGLCRQAKYIKMSGMYKKVLI